MPRIDPELRRTLVADAAVGRLATVTAAGRPHIVPCCFVLAADGGSGRDAIYSVVDGKPKSTMALKRLDNIRANPAASLVVDRYDDDWSQLWWVRVDGDASVLDAGEESAAAVELLAAKYHQYRETPPTGEVLRVEVTDWSDWTASVFDARL